MKLTLIDRTNIDDLFSLMDEQDGWMRSNSKKVPNIDNYVGDNKFVYGIYDEAGYLLSSMGAIYSEKLNFFYLFNMVTRKNKFSFFNLKTNGLALIWEHILTESLSKGYYSFFWLHAARGWPMKKFQTLYYDSIPSFHKYYRCVMCYIPAHTLPEFSLYKSWLGNKVWDVDSVIEQAVLKPEYHPAGYKMYNL